MMISKTCLNVIQGPINLKIDESSMNLDAIDMKVNYLYNYSYYFYTNSLKLANRYIVKKYCKHI